MVIAYGNPNFQHIARIIHQYRPDVSVVYLNAISDTTFNTMLEKNQIDIYLCGGINDEPYFRNDSTRQKFKGNIMDMDRFYSTDGMFLKRAFVLQLNEEIANVNIGYHKE